MRLLLDKMRFVKYIKLSHKIFVTISLFQLKELPLHSLSNRKLTDSLAQLVEHNTFNVGVMGSSPMRVTKRKRGVHK